MMAEGEGRQKGPRCSVSVMENVLHPSTAGGMDQSKPAEQQGEDSHPGREKEETGGAQEEDCGVEEAAEALELEDGGAEDEWTEKQEEASFCLTALPTLLVETLASGAEVEPLRQVALAQEKHHHDSQVHVCLKSVYLNQTKLDQNILIRTLSQSYRRKQTIYYKLLSNFAAGKLRNHSAQGSTILSRDPDEDAGAA